LMRYLNRTTLYRSGQSRPRDQGAIRLDGLLIEFSTRSIIRRE
jgi:hypothetical protein